MRRHEKTRNAAAVLGAVILTIGVTTAVAGVVTSPSVTGTPTAAVSAPEPVSSLSTSQAALDALSQPAGAASLPLKLRRELDGTRMAGENADLGRKALTTSFGWTYWVLPAADGKVCLFVNGGGGGCGPAAQISDGTFSLVTPCADGGPVYAGLLANDAAEPFVTLTDGSRRTLTITNNVWAIQVPRDQPQPTSIAWTRAGTVQHAAVDASLTPGTRCAEAS